MNAIRARPGVRAGTVAAVLGLWAWACAGPRPVTRQAPAVVPAPVAFGDAGVPPPALLLAALRARVDRLQSLGATLRIRGLRALPGVTVLADAWVGRPAWAYVGVRGPLGPPMDELITDGQRWRWMSVRPGAGGQQGTAEDLPALLPLAVGPHQFVGALLGLPLPPDPPLEGAPCDAATAALHPSPFCLALTYPPPQEPLTLWGDASFQVSVARIGGAAAAVTLEYLGYQTVDGVTFPAHLRANQPLGQGPPVEVRVVQAQPNAPRPSTLFEPLGNAPGSPSRDPSSDTVMPSSNPVIPSSNPSGTPAANAAGP